jgi:Ca2+-binding EF-hand superfamily protein
MEAAFSASDEDGNGTISQHEFLRLFSRTTGLSEQQVASSAQAAFTAFARDCSGGLNLSEFMTCVGFCPPLAQAFWSQYAAPAGGGGVPGLGEDMDKL